MVLSRIRHLDAMRDALSIGEIADVLRDDEVFDVDRTRDWTVLQRVMVDLLTPRPPNPTLKSI
jgi:hypothetical protein